MTAPPVAGGAPQGAQPQVPSPPVGLPQQPQAAMTPQQQAAEAMIANERQHIAYLAGVPGMAAVADTRLKTLQEQISKGEYYVPGIGMVPLAGHAENAAYRQGLEKSSTENATYYGNYYNGLRGKASIAGLQKQNIAILQSVFNDPNFVSGSADQKRLIMQRGLATLGYNVDASAANEVFKTVVTRILADQFAALKSDSTITGENAPRIFQSMLKVEEQALPNENDSLEGLRRKVDIFDKSGDYSIKWADDADKYAAAHGGRLDANFDMQLRHEMARTRLYSMQETQTGASPQAGGAPTAGQGGTAGEPSIMSKADFAKMPDGPIDSGPFRGKIKQGMQIVDPSGPLGSRTNPHPESWFGSIPKEGDYLYWKGSLHRRKGNTYEPVQAGP